ncbi:MAG: hypothetical protein BWY11_00373 [Firmicutes bacterium ADurb.Bin182]|nr:MAG: hypothetical protein BWY11_00373 [Firmicutes bacterium ADurb.Bin182]
MSALHKEPYVFVKPSLDAHTLGINQAAELLRSCGYDVIVGDETVENALSGLESETNRELLSEWLRQKGAVCVGISYRLDAEEAVKIVGYMMNELEKKRMLSYQGGPIKAVFFAGLPKACERIEKEHKGFVRTFQGGETVRETLAKMGVPDERIPAFVTEGSRYDDMRLEFGRDLIRSGRYEGFVSPDRSGYAGYGTRQDTIEKRLDFSMLDTFAPLIRAHVGPYSSLAKRADSVREFIGWARSLSETRFIDILSIGTSQLTQSHFGEDWDAMPNGGGVPINSPEEYQSIWEASRPLLVRTYAGTKNIPALAKMHEETMNICWHALSLWWFNKLDNRGPYDLITNLKEHIETMKYIAASKKPFEPNVPHHFAFRGADDITYIVSAYLAAKLAKLTGIKTLVLQNMLNTPRLTWGVQDLAKSRALLKLIKELENEDFRVIFQPRAGLDYFKPDLEEAKAQLAAVTALMDDIDPHNEKSPPVIHVVSYSEASHLATPAIIDESVKITQYALKKYREMRRKGQIEDMHYNRDVFERTARLIAQARIVIAGIERFIGDPYTADGLYLIFAAGFLPVPYLWGCVDEFEYATAYKTSLEKGGVKILGKDGIPITAEKLVEIAAANIPEVKYRMSNKR